MMLILLDTKHMRFLWKLNYTACDHDFIGSIVQVIMPPEVHPALAQ